MAIKRKYPSLKGLLLLIGYLSAGFGSSFDTASAGVSHITKQPILSVDAASYKNKLVLRMVTATEGAVIHYTTDGTKPDAQSPTYSGSVIIDNTTTVQAFASKVAFKPSTIVKADYSLPLLQLVPVSFSVSGGIYHTAQTLTLSAEPGATILYTDNGRPLDDSARIYNKPLTIDEHTTILAYAVKTGYADSEVTDKTYAIEIEKKERD